MSLFSKVRDIFKGNASVKRKKVYHNVLVRDPNEVWEIITEIGDGAYGKVYKVRIFALLIQLSATTNYIELYRKFLYVFFIRWVILFEEIQLHILDSAPKFRFWFLISFYMNKLIIGMWILFVLYFLKGFLKYCISYIPYHIAMLFINF